MPQAPEITDERAEPRPDGRAGGRGINRINQITLTNWPLPHAWQGRKVTIERHPTIVGNGNPLYDPPEDGRLLLGCQRPGASGEPLHDCSESDLLRTASVLLAG